MNLSSELKSTLSPDQNTLATGAAGVLTWLITMVLGRYKIILPADVQAGIVVIVMYLVSHFTPMSTKDIVTLANSADVRIAAYTPPISAPMPPKSQP